MAVCCGLALCSWICACLALVPSADVAAAATLCRFGASGACDQSVAAAVQMENCEREALYALCSSAGLMTSIAVGLGHCYCSGGLPRRCSDLCYAATSGHGGVRSDDTSCSSVCPGYVTWRHAAQEHGAVYGSESSGGGDIGCECSTLLYPVVAIAAVVTVLLLVVFAILFTAKSRCGSRCLDETFSKPRVHSAKAWSTSVDRGASKKSSGNSLGGYFKAQNINESADPAHKKTAAAAVTVAASPPLLAQLTTEKQ